MKAFWLRAAAAWAWVRREQLARYDDRTLVIIAVCLAVALGAVNGVSQRWAEGGTPLLLLAAGGLLSSTAVAMGVWRGRLGDCAATVCLLLLVTAATLQTMSTPADQSRWVSIYGLAGVPMVALMLTRRRGTAIVTAGAVLHRSRSSPAATRRCGRSSPR
ncbi:hypothetical protein SAMN06264364_11525 [Quadrisphaera granulorum]|uniref:Uncharacterized protein n=1 Tax=Quadrisphaera granulorum TaxID=317664 RepID=A0A316A708_9ACTN|nr:hypothetical protein [Quadrisphaera granulorum]PWJ53008.1 hypothetical protein BXY45_11525 [Quadrisphaera granulorum]SZE97173.1 hypothetical protein SAMN06264364_11525 [Quadrisphaera granulorum]